MSGDTIVHMVPETSRPWHPSYPAAYEFTTRTETLRKFAAMAHVDRRMLENDEPNVIDHTNRMLNERIRYDVAKAGRQPHGEITYEQREDFMRNTVVFSASVLTRENHEGHWGEVWDAIHQDEQDRIDNLEENES